MRTTRILALSAAALVSVGLLTAPPASAATTVFIDCATPSTTSVQVSPGEEIGFQLNGVCVTALGLLSPAVDSEGTFAAFVTSIVQNDTGATIATSWNGGSNPTITYVAGSRPGTDSLILSTAVPRIGVRTYRTLGVTNAYYMTVAQAATPAPWLQAIGRTSQVAPCPDGWGPSWAEWPNKGTGGFVCVREYYYDTSTAAWAYR